MSRALLAGAWIAAALALAAPAAAHHPVPSASLRATALAPQGCTGGDPIAPTQVITGSFSAEQAGSYVMLPFDVPAGTTAVRVKYCYDQPENFQVPMARHTLDLGLWHARPDASTLWGEAQFRGWGGSSHPDVTVSEQGFSTEEQYLADPDGHVPGRTTRGFRPGPVPAGQWAVELDVAGVVGREMGDADGSVGWRVEIALSGDPSFDDDPYRAAPYDLAPARAEAGWYAGDLHVHGEHSALGDAPMSELFGFAFRPRAEGGAGLDFVTLSDYVAGASWGEVGRHQPDHPGKLIARATEVITQRGHLNNQGALRYVDHRTGPVLERRDDGSLELVRGPTPASVLFDQIHAAGGFTQINHPTIFPSQVPLFELFCRGCPWDYTDPETDYSKVDAIEIATGPGGLQDPMLGPNPFTPLAIEFYEDALRTGARIAAIGVSDSHNAGRTPGGITQAPIGQATTMVYADELSEAGIARAVRARHTYVKVFSSDGPDLRLEARAPGMEGPPAIMGDVVRAGQAHLTARVLGADPAGGYVLLVVRDGVPIGAYPVTSRDFSQTFPAVGEGRYRLQLQRAGTTIEGVTSPIWLDADAAPEARRPDAAFNTVRARVGRALRMRGGRVVVPCAATGHAIERCVARLRARPRGGPVVTIGRGSAPLRGGEANVAVRLNRAGRALMGRRGANGFPLTVEARADGPRGEVGPDRRRTRARLHR